jgi:hypothetical protein
MSAVAAIACRVCGAPSRWLRDGPLLGRRVGYFDCAACGYFQTEVPTWLDEAYSSAINDVDTGLMARNLHNLRRVVMTLAAFRRLHGRVVDHAGGYGILVRLLRDVGVDAYWQDKYCANLVARGFEADAGPCELLTAFEVFEHFELPLKELRAMLERAPRVLLSTELIAGEAPPPADWWYLGAAHGQHIGFFRPRTLAWMAQRLGVHHASDGRRLHCFARDPVPARWLRGQRLHRLWPLVARWALRPLTQSDHDRLTAETEA